MSKNHYQKVYEYKKNWYEQNKEKAKKKAAIRRSKRKHVFAWRGLLHSSLKRLKTPKRDSTLNLLGYSAEELKHHLESLWLPEMNWSNYGEWHIDHIKPLHTFEPHHHPSITNALENLRPMWATTRIINNITYEGNLNRKRKCIKQF